MEFGKRRLEPEVIEQVKSQFKRILRDCEAEVTISNSGDELVDAISPTLNTLLDYRRAILADLSGLYPSSLGEFLAKNSDD